MSLADLFKRNPSMRTPTLASTVSVLDLAKIALAKGDERQAREWMCMALRYLIPANHWAWEALDRLQKENDEEVRP